MELIEKAICECYTGYVFCVGEEREAIYKYLESLNKAPVFTHELAKTIEAHQEEIKEDFKAVCAREFERKEETERRKKLEKLIDDNIEFKVLIQQACAKYASCIVCPLRSTATLDCRASRLADTDAIREKRYKRP